MIGSSNIINSAVCEALQVTTIVDKALFDIIFHDQYPSKDSSLVSFIKTKSWFQTKHQLALADLVGEQLTFFPLTGRNIHHFNLSKRRDKLLIVFTIAGTINL